MNRSVLSLLLVLLPLTLSAQDDNRKDPAKTVGLTHIEVLDSDEEYSLWEEETELNAKQNANDDGDDGEVLDLTFSEEDEVEFLEIAKKRSGRNCAARSGGASWYGPGFHGRTTANGERFNQNSLTAAHKTLKFGTRVRVTYRGKSVVVRINDAGPYAGGRVIDLSKAAAAKIGLIGAGHGHVQLEVISCK